jgi:hypothetical protein
MKARPVKRQKTTLKSLEKRRQMRHRPDPGRWFYSFVPFKVATGGATPLIPLLTMNVGGGPADVGIVNAIGSTFSMLGGLFWGKLSDRLNLKEREVLVKAQELDRFVPLIIKEGVIKIDREKLNQRIGGENNAGED